MEIVDEDPAQRRISPGGQFCEEIGGIVVLSRDVMQLDPLEFFLELAHLLKRPDFHKGKSTESKYNKTVVDQITQIPVEYHINTTIISEYIRCGIT